MRSRKREHRLAHRISLTKRAAHTRQSAASLRRKLDDALQSLGGWPGIAESLGPAATADLVARIAETAQAEELRAIEIDRQAAPKLDDPRLQRELAQMGLQWITEHPKDLQPHMAALLSGMPSLITPASLRAPTVKRWLSQNGFFPKSD